jgi:hypothetical protein
VDPVHPDRFGPGRVETIVVGSDLQYCTWRASQVRVLAH